MPEYLQERKQFSIDRIAKIKKALTNIFGNGYSNKICIYATGSYARHEANSFSDLDVFIAVGNDGKEDFTLSRVQECEIIHGLEEMRRELELPEYTDGGEYLKIHSAAKLTGNIGNNKDDYENTFTARMLLLLESKPLYGGAVYEGVMKRITNAYFNDFHEHVDQFNPVFLVNDILRFWRTMCLNYENKRTYRTENRDKGHLQNLKLKFSRLLICFATIGYLAEKGRGFTQEDMIELIELIPHDRLCNAVRDYNEFKDDMENIVLLYGEFMKSMNASSDEIRVFILNEENRIEAFKNAKKFGDIMYDIVFKLAKKSNVERFLVV